MHTCAFQTKEVHSKTSALIAPWAKEINKCAINKYIMSNLSIGLTRTVMINIIGPVEPCLFPLNENILQHFNFQEPSVLSWYYFAWKQIRQILCSKLEILRTSIKKSSLFCSFLGEPYYALYVTCTCKCIHERLVLKSCPPVWQESITLHKIIYLKAREHL